MATYKSIAGRRIFLIPFGAILAKKILHDKAKGVANNIDNNVTCKEPIIKLKPPNLPESGSHLLAKKNSLTLILSKVCKPFCDTKIIIAKTITVIKIAQAHNKYLILASINKAFFCLLKVGVIVVNSSVFSTSFYLQHLFLA